MFDLSSNFQFFFLAYCLLNGPVQKGKQEMKRVFKTNLILGWIGSACLFSGCGPARALPVPKSQVENPEIAVPSDENDIARQLGLRVVPELAGTDKNDFKRPDLVNGLQSFSKIDQSIRIDQDKVLYTHFIEMNPSASLFFVWSENFLNSKIIRAQLTHRVINQKNERVGHLKQTEALLEPTDHHWFFPILDLIQSSALPQSESDLHQTTLLLTLANHSQIQIHIHFRVRILKNQKGKGSL